VGLTILNPYSYYPFYWVVVQERLPLLGFFPGFIPSSFLFRQLIRKEISLFIRVFLRKSFRSLLIGALKRAPSCPKEAFIITPLLGPYWGSYWPFGWFRYSRPGKFTHLLP